MLTTIDLHNRMILSIKILLNYRHRDRRKAREEAVMSTFALGLMTSWTDVGGNGWRLPRGECWSLAYSASHWPLIKITFNRCSPTGSAHHCVQMKLMSMGLFIAALSKQEHFLSPNFTREKFGWCKKIRRSDNRFRSRCKNSGVADFCLSCEFLAD